MTAKPTLKQLVGQLFVVGFDGYCVPPLFKQTIQEFHLGGVLYLKRNVQSPGQLAELSNELQFSARPENCPFLFTTIDHEGGKVNRLVQPFTKFPGNDHLGELGSPKIGFQFGAIIGKELKAVGINVNLAPVVDVATNPKNPAMNSRMFSADPEVCAKLGSAVIRGLQKAGVMAVAKHFPGHGDTKEDTHFHLARVNKSQAELEKCEILPFRRVIRSRVEGVMTAHILNSQLDEKYPATLSEKTIDGILRNQLRFSKVVFTDDMEMKAIADHFGADEAAVLAVNAGCDCLIYKGDSGAHLKGIEAVIKAIEDKRIPKTRVELAYHRIQTTKKTYAELKGPVDVTEVGKHIGLPEHLQLADIIEKKELPPDWGKNIPEE